MPQSGPAVQPLVPVVASVASLSPSAGTVEPQRDPQEGRHLAKEVYVPLSRVLNGEMDSHLCQELQRRVSMLEAELAASHQRENKQRLEIAELRRRLKNAENEGRVYSI